MDANFIRILTAIFFLGYGVNYFLGHRVLGIIVAICAIIVGLFALLGF